MPVGGILILFFDCFYLLAGLFGLFITIRKSEIETFHYTVGGDSLVDGLIQVLNPILFPQSLGAGASQVVEQVGAGGLAGFCFKQPIACFKVFFRGIIADPQINNMSAGYCLPGLSDLDNV